MLAQTISDIIRKEMICGVPQRSFIGLLLSNIAFYEILKEDVPPGISIVRYNNDSLVVTAEGDIPMLEWKVNTALEAMTCCIESAGQSVATMKMEAVLFT